MKVENRFIPKFHFDLFTNLESESDVKYEYPFEDCSGVEDISAKY